MKLKQLEAQLGYLAQFQSPKDAFSKWQGNARFRTKVELEQYPTGPHIASRMLFMAESTFGDIRGKLVADLGCGCGTLGVAASLLDAGYVSGFDVDDEALELAQQNSQELETVLDLVQCDIMSLPSRGVKFDTVVMNPPFGTRKKGADMEFLSAALKVAESAVYSLHKTSTREHIKRKALRDYGAQTAEVLCELRFDLRALYKFHKRQEVDIAVDLWRFSPLNR